MMWLTLAYWHIPKIGTEISMCSKKTLDKAYSNGIPDNI